MHVLVSTGRQAEHVPIPSELVGSTRARPGLIPAAARTALPCGRPRPTARLRGGRPPGELGLCAAGAGLPRPGGASVLMTAGYDAFAPCSATATAPALVSLTAPCAGVGDDAPPRLPGSARG